MHRSNEIIQKERNFQNKKIKIIFFFLYILLMSNLEIVRDNIYFRKYRLIIKTIMLQISLIFL